MIFHRPGLTLGYIPSIRNRKKRALRVKAFWREHGGITVRLRANTYEAEQAIARAKRRVERMFDAAVMGRTP